MGSNAENSRTSLRRLARHEETGFSNASILNSMERFVKSVNEMEETILVPSRLLDLAVGDASDTTSSHKPGQRSASASTQDNLANTDLYRLYDILNRMKVELLWSQDRDDVQEHQQQTSQSSSQQQQQQHTHPQEGHQAKPGHARYPSTASMQSVQSASSIVSSSDSESDAGIENDSGLESEQEPRDRLAMTAEHFRRHLRGLHRCVDRMTEAAEYLTQRYQVDVGGQV